MFLRIKEVEGKGLLGILLRMKRPAGKPLRERLFRVNDQECRVDILGPDILVFQNRAEIAGFKNDYFLLWLSTEGITGRFAYLKREELMQNFFI